MDRNLPILNYQPPRRGRSVRFIVYTSLGVTLAIVAGFLLIRALTTPVPKYVVPNPHLIDRDMLKTALEYFEVENGRYPTTAEGFNALLICPSGLTATWRGPFAPKIPFDKWGRSYSYRCPGIADPDSYDLTSSGPDGHFGTADDIEKNTEY